MVGDVKKQRSNFVIALVVCLCFLAGSFGFVFYMLGQNNEKSVRHLEDITRQTQGSLYQQIQSDFQIMRGVAIGLEALPDLPGAELQAVLREINNSNDFERMGYADASGVLDMVDLDGSVYAGVDISGTDFFSAALAGEEAFSSTVFDDIKQEYVNYYAIPVKRDGEMLGVLCAINQASILRHVIDVPVFQGEGFFCIINKAGQIVGPSYLYVEALHGSASLVDVATFTPSQYEAYQTATESDETEVFHFTLDGKEQISVAQPLGVNGWSVVSVLPASVFSTYYNFTAVGTFIITCVASLIFLFLMQRQRNTLLRSQQSLETLAFTDPLTGMRNNTKFQLDAADLLSGQPGTPFAVWSFDVKQFKNINNIFGYNVGDAVLRDVAKLLQDQSEGNAMFARISADQFTGLCPYNSRQEMETWFCALQNAVEDKVGRAHGRMPMDLSMGVYCLEAGDAQRPLNELINLSLMAKRIAKEQSGSNIAFFEPGILETMHRETRLTAASRPALHAGRFFFHLQPKIDIQNTGELVMGAEALGRWSDPQLGDVSPGEFIPLFEKNGFIVDFDRYIFEQTCKWYSEYTKKGNPPLIVSINLSRLGVLQPDCVDYYAAIKQKYGIANGVLELELTESMIMDDYQLFLDTLNHLHAHGFLCSIDDFGSGYSSLNVLNTLPMDVLKLDAAFFRARQPQQREYTIIANVVHMAGELGVKTVAEGVEAAEQVTFLRRIGCNAVQGYYFAKPMPPAQFTEFVQQRVRGAKASVPDYSI